MHEDRVVENEGAVARLHLRREGVLEEAALVGIAGDHQRARQPAARRERRCQPRVGRPWPRAAEPTV